MKYLSWLFEHYPSSFCLRATKLYIQLVPYCNAAERVLSSYYVGTN